MFLLDTDHITLIDRGGAEGKRLIERLAQIAPGDIAASIISYEEQMRGWLSYVARLQAIDRQIEGYRRLERMLRFYCVTPMLPFDEKAAEQFHQLWLTRPRMGTMDMKIAAIALANDATLLTRNLSDFNRISGLRVDDWTL